jgi:transposase-like protein
VEVDEAYGSPEEGTVGGGVQDKALVVTAAQADGKGIALTHMGVIQHLSAACLHRLFVEDGVEPGSIVHTDDCQGYAGLNTQGYDHEVTPIRKRPKGVPTLMPRVNLVASLLKRWLAGTHQGAASHEHLPYYLDEFTVRFNRRKSRSRGKLFFRVVQRPTGCGYRPNDLRWHYQALHVSRCRTAVFRAT